MDNSTIWQLYPQPAQEVELPGLYLSHDIRQYGEQRDRAFVYSNYVTSLDGRIAIPRPDGHGMMVPEDTANERDWRLFQELAAQADLIITSGRYLRDYDEGRVQEILRSHDDPRFADLKAWREDRGLPPQPDLAVVSGSLHFPIPDALANTDRKILVFTHGGADKERIKDLEAHGGMVFVAGDDSVSGRQMVDIMSERGYRTVYMSTGPQVHHLLLEGKAIDRLYLTYASRLLGGRPFSSVVEGDLLQPAYDMKMQTLYFDPYGLDGLGQLFITYDVSG